MFTEHILCTRHQRTVCFAQTPAHTLHALPTSPSTLPFAPSPPGTAAARQAQAGLRAFAEALPVLSALPQDLLAGSRGAQSNATSFDGPSQPAIAPAVILSLFSFTAHFPYGKAEAKLRHKTLWVLHQRVYEPGISFILTTTPQDPARPLLFRVARGPGPSDPMMFLHDGSSFGHPPLHAVPSAQGLPTPNWLTPIPVLVC